MKRVIGLCLALLSLSSFAGNLDIAHRYQDALDAEKVEQNGEKARVLLEEILGNISNEHALFDDIYKSYLRVSNIKDDDEYKNAINFATGRKNETFCKGIGLVYSEAFHNNGTISKLYLAENNRVLANGSYSVMTEGRWKYYLDTEYRLPIKSEVWINSANENHYDIQELRQTADGRDRGKWTAKWKDGSFTGNSSTKGNTQEPIPMYMAIDYQAWGTRDLGYRINFKVGETQKTQGNVSTFSHGRIRLTGERVVKKKLKMFSTTDFDNITRDYKDCYLVETQIMFSGMGSR